MERRGIGNERHASTATNRENGEWRTPLGRDAGWEGFANRSRVLERIVGQPITGEEPAVEQQHVLRAWVRSSLSRVVALAGRRSSDDVHQVTSGFRTAAICARRMGP
jgi:hypothetical protein